MGYKSKQRILNRSISNGQKMFKKCLTSLAIREMQIKMTLIFYFTPVRMAKTKYFNANQLKLALELS